jgi:predicted ester cyclase
MRRHSQEYVMTADTIFRVDMDRLVDEHFRAEMEVHIPAILAGFTDDIEHDIVGRPVRFRLLHIFEFRDWLIDRENAWLDVTAVQRQLTSG